MKEWIQENKFIAGLIGGIIALALLLGGLIYSTLSSYTESKEAVAKLDGDIKKIKEKHGNPSQLALDSLRLELTERDARAKAVFARASKVGYHKLDLLKSNTDFAALLKAYVGRSRAKLEKADVEFVKDHMFGFNDYEERMIVTDRKAIGLALYQMEAFDNLLDTVAAIKPSSFNGIYRPMTSEEGQSSTSTKKKGSKKSKSQSKSKGDAKPKAEVFRRLPFEMSLSLTEAQLVNLLDKITNSSDHAFVIKNLRITNSKLTPIPFPTIMRPAEEASAADAPVGEFDFAPTEDDVVDDEEGTDEVQPTVSKGEKILEQVHGLEKLNVALVLELHLYENPKKLALKPLK